MVRGKAKLAAGAVALLAVIGALGAGSARAQGPQDDTYRLLREAIISPTTAYLALPAEFLCSDGANLISTSPDGKDVVIRHTVTSSPRTAAAFFLGRNKRELETLRSGGSQVVQMLLFSEGDDHAQVVWRGGMSRTTGFTEPNLPLWLPGSRLALLQVHGAPGPLPELMFNAEATNQSEGDPPPVTQTLIVLNTATGKTQTLVANLKADTNVIVSRTDPVAAVVQRDDKTGTGIVQRIGADGRLGAPILFTKPDGKQRLPYWTGFLPDGKTLTGVVLQDPILDQPRQRTVYELDTLTGSITESTTKKVVPGAQPPMTTDADLPYTVHRGKQTITRDGVTTTIYPLWLESRGKEFTGKTLIASDSDGAGQVVVLQSAVLYQHRGAIYAVPILKSNAPEFLAKRREMQKQETINRAKQIGLGMLMYAQDYDENFPPVGSDLAKTIGPYVKNDTLFQNPATGQGGFTPLYKATGLASFEEPATTPLATMSGPGGVAVIYVDGHVKWKDDGSGNP